MPELIPEVAEVRDFLRERCTLPDTVERLELSYLKVKRESRDGTFLYEAAGERGPALRVFARRFPPAIGRKLERSINRRRPGSWVPAGAAGAPPAVYSPGMGLLFQIFPADRKLETLPTLADGRAMAPVLEAALKRASCDATVHDVGVHVVRYKPERKCVLRYDIRWTAEAATLPGVVYAKILRPPRLARTPWLLAAIREAGSGLLFDLPDPLGFLPRLGAELYSRVPGTALSALSEADEFPGICVRVARALRQFHDLRVPLEPRPVDRLAHLRQSADDLTLLLPGEGERVAPLRRRLEARMAAAPRPAPALVHGDFHGDNVLVAGGRLGLVDLDDCAAGDPADDLGSMWAQLTWLSIKGGRTPRTLKTGRRAFLDTYLEQGPPDIAGRAMLHAALHCFLFAGQCLRHPRAAARREQARALLAACRGILQSGLP